MTILEVTCVLAEDENHQGHQMEEEDIDNCHNLEAVVDIDASEGNQGTVAVEGEGQLSNH